MRTKFKVVFSFQSKQDIREAKKWYNKQQKGLGKRFVEQVERVIASIKLNPYFASIKYDNIRTAACKIFPYTVHYEINEPEELVRIIMVMHHSREPFWNTD